MKRRQYSLPDERPLGALDRDGGQSVVSIFGCLSLPSVAGYIWRGSTRGEWGWGVAGLVISFGFAWLFSHGLAVRRTEGGSRGYRRFDHPVRYWGVLLVWLVAYLLSVSTFFFAHNSTAGGSHR